jgi:hypothetical protein
MPTLVAGEQPVRPAHRNGARWLADRPPRRLVLVQQLVDSAPKVRGFLAKSVLTFASALLSIQDVIPISAAVAASITCLRCLSWDQAGLTSRCRSAGDGPTALR